MSKPASTDKSRARDFQALRRKSAGSTKRPSGAGPEQAEGEPIAPRHELAAAFQARIRANLREMLDFDERSIPDIAAAAWPDQGRESAGLKLNRLKRPMGTTRLWTPIEYHHAAALAEALGVDPGDFYEAG